MAAPRLGVVWGPGAAGALEVVHGLTGLAEPVFLTPPDSDPYLDSIAGQLGCEVRHVVAEDPSSWPGLGLQGLLTFSERRVELTSLMTTTLGLPGLSTASMQALTDKAAQRRALHDAGIPMPRVWMLDDLATLAAALDEVGPPAVLKPRRGEGSRSTVLLRARDDARPDALKAAGVDVADGRQGWLLEELLTGRPGGLFGDYVSVESVVHSGRQRRSSVTGKLPLVPPFRESGGVCPNPLPFAEAAGLVRLAEAAIAALDVTDAVTHTEIKLTPQGPRVIEVNGRMGGAGIRWLTRRGSGHDLLRDAAAVALGRELEAPATTSGGVVFNFSNIVPGRTARLVQVIGADRVRRLDGVIAYHPLVPVGVEVPAGSGSNQMDLISCQAPTHAAVWPLLARVVDSLAFDIADADGRTTRVPARNLPSAAVVAAAGMWDSPA